MKSLLAAALAGVLCLPATFRLSRDGNFLGTALVVVVIAAIGGAIGVGMSRGKGKPRLVHFATAFVIGAFVSELMFFSHYYFTFGYQDQLLSVGIIMLFVEASSIALLGGFATCLAALVQRRESQH